jgi:membrane protease YdiL (CAAX protease family)
MIAAYFVLQLCFGYLVGHAVSQLNLWFTDARGIAPLPAAMYLPTVVIVSLSLGTLSVLALVRWRWRDWLFVGKPPGLGVAGSHQRWLSLATIAGVATPFVGGYLTQWLAGDHSISQAITELGEGTPWAMRVVLLLFVVTAGPLVEELLFRGLLLGGLLRHMGPLAAGAISATAFACVHIPDMHGALYAMPNLALLGGVCAWLRLRSGSLWPAVFAHGINNLLAAAAWFSVGH